VRQDAPFPDRHFRVEGILNGDPAASPLGGAHRRGAPYSSHRAPQRVRLRFFLACGLAMGKTRVSARVGREGEMEGLFDQPDYYEIAVDIRN